MCKKSRASEVVGGNLISGVRVAGTQRNHVCTCHIMNHDMNDAMNVNKALEFRIASNYGWF
jgi:hypothetical protein